MRTVFHLESNFKLEKSVVSIGNFDGVHLGHQKILEDMGSDTLNSDLPKVVVSFEPHPQKVLFPKKAPKIIKTSKQKRDLLRKNNVDYLYIIPFTPDFSKTEPEDFVTDILLNILGASAIFVGQNFSFGKNRRGNIQFLQDMGQSNHFTVHPVNSVMVDNEVISSSRIRACLQEGDVQTASRLLGRHYYMEGIVVKGKQLGRKLGYPTANIVSDNELIPKLGVYATQTVLNGTVYDTVTNIGLKPTFGGNELIVETHFFDFNSDIYGELIEIRYIEFIRPEIKFDNIDTLVQKIEEDCTITKKLLEKLNY